MADQLQIQDLVHPLYERSIEEWMLWRYTYASGLNFLNRYLKTYSRRESEADFALRKEITYVPAYAKQAINEIKNSIFQRMPDVTRVGGSKSYQKACMGLDGGVDLFGRSMNSYMGTRVLPELLSMSRVGVFVDMPALSGITMASDLGAKPYLYLYKAEDIRTWRFDQYSEQVEYSNLLLRDYIFKYDDETGLPIGEIQRYRRLWIEDGKVHCKFYAEGGSPYSGDSIDNAEENEEIILDIPRIPFVVVQISDSLLVDVARYQIALMNLESSDISYVLKSNFPFYIEEYDPRTSSQFTRNTGLSQGGEALDAMTGKVDEVKVGATAGRRYPKGTNPPAFINPSSDPLKASMEKQEQMKRSIRQLVMLAVANLEPQKMASADSKAADDKGLEAGLSYIGLELENAERRLAGYWSAYEKGNSPAQIFYPEKYELRSDGAKLEEAEKLAKLMEQVPSNQYKREIAKRIAVLLLRNKIDNDTFNSIMDEIDKAPATTTDPEVIQTDVELGIASLELASKMRGYPSGEVEKAKTDHAERLARIAAAQNKFPDKPGVSNGQSSNMASRGVGDFSGSPVADASAEKKDSRDTTHDAPVKDKQRGKGTKEPIK